MRPVTATLSALPRATPAAAQDLAVREIGSFHIGGRIATLEGPPTQEISFTTGAPPFRCNPNGQFQAERMQVQHVRLAKPRARYPLLMWRGGGLAGVTWETHPGLGRALRVLMRLGVWGEGPMALPPAGFSLC